MKIQAGRHKPWLLPFIVTGGLLLGCFFGRIFSSNAMSLPGPSGDIAGAASALLLLICFSSGIVLSSATVLLGKIFYRCRFERFLLRFVLCFAGGVVIGILGDSDSSVMTSVLWSLLISLPIFLSWPSGTIRK